MPPAGRWPRPTSTGNGRNLLRPKRSLLSLAATLVQVCCSIPGAKTAPPFSIGLRLRKLITSAEPAGRPASELLWRDRWGEHKYGGSVLADRIGLRFAGRPVQAAGVNKPSTPIRCE